MVHLRKIIFICIFILPCALAAKVQHSTFTVPLSKVDQGIESDFVRRVHALKNEKKSVFLELRENDMVSEVSLRNQVIASKKLATYFGEISVGKNPTTKFKVLFDTGSCEFWVPDATCLTSQCKNHNKYHKSSTFEPRYMQDGQPSLMDVEYLSGKLQGYDGYETVILGNGIVVPHQIVSFATIIDIPLLKELAWDGIVGLGFRNNEMSMREVVPLMDHIISKNILRSKNLANQFSYYLSKDGGAITFGGADLSFKRSPHEEFMWVPVNPSNSYWTIKVLGVRKENRNREPMSNVDYTKKDSGFHDGGRDSIVDTGTYLVYAPSETMENYLSDIKVNSCDDKAKLPNLVFQLQGNTKNLAAEPTVVELTLTPDDYVLEFEENGQLECFLGIAADEAEETDNIGGWTFGQVFLRSFYTVFDRDHQEIGFVRSKAANVKNSGSKKKLKRKAKFHHLGYSGQP